MALDYISLVEALAAIELPGAVRMDPRPPAAEAGGAPDEVEYLMPEEYVKILLPVFESAAFPFLAAPGLVHSVRMLSGRPIRHHRIPVKAGYVAMLFVGRRALELSNSADNLMMIPHPFATNGAKGLFVFSDSRSIAEAVGRLKRIWLELYPGMMGVEFLTAGFFDEMTRAIDSGQCPRWIADRLSLEKYNQSCLTLADLKKNRKDREFIITAMAEQASLAPPALGMKGYFQILILRTNWPDPWKNDRCGALTGVPDADARLLVEWTLGQGLNPQDPNCTLLGDLIDNLRGDVGLEKRRRLEELRDWYGLGKPEG